MIIILLCIENNKTKILPPRFADFTRLLFGNSTNVESAEIQNIFWHFFDDYFHSLAIGQQR